MKSFFAKISIILLVCGGVFGIERLSHTLTDGFSAANISSNLPHNSNWDISFSENDLNELKQALSQNYSYLASGSQSYVFVSDDDQYVIKFFKHKRWRLNPFYKKVPLPSFLNKKREKWLYKKRRTINSTFNSCKISYLDFHDQTGIIYLHLNKTHSLNRNLIVSDRLKLQHNLNLDDFEFVVQKKAMRTDYYLIKLRKEKKLDEAKKTINALLNFTMMLCDKGYSDKDPHLVRNFGFIDNQVVEIDVGGFFRDPKKNKQYFYSYEINKIRNKLLPWMKKNYPELVSYTDNQINEIIASNLKVDKEK